MPSVAMFCVMPCLVFKVKAVFALSLHMAVALRVMITFACVCVFE